MLKISSERQKLVKIKKVIFSGIEGIARVSSALLIDVLCTHLAIRDPQSDPESYHNNKRSENPLSQGHCVGGITHLQLFSMEMNSCASLKLYLRKTIFAYKDLNG